MATILTNSTRLTAKNLFSAPPPGGGAAVDSVNLTFQIQQQTGGQIASGSVSIVMPLADDVFKVGNYYDMTLADGVAPTSAKEKPPTD